MDQKRAAAALFALAACFACSTAAPTTGNQTALDLFEAPVEGCYYNFQHYGEGDRIMTNEPCLNCTCHNRMLMCYLRVCPFTKPIGQDCTVEKRADQCCPIVTCPDVPVDLLTSTSTSSPAEYGATGLGRLDKYGCSINGKYFPEGAKVPPTPNKPCEHCYCIHNMTTCVMQECTLHVDGCTPIYHKDVCCPIRYSCDHPEDEIPLLDDMTTTVRPTPGFLLTTTTMMPVTQATQDCIHDDKIFADGALIKTEKACEHCYCMKGDIVCVVQECGTPMENEGKNCTSLQPKHGQCCPDTYICEGDDIPTTGFYEETTTLSPPRRVGVEGSGYRNEPDELYTEIPSLDTESEGSGEEQLLTTIPSFNAIKDMPETTNEDFYQYSTEPEKEITVLNLTTEKGDQGDDILVTTSPSTLPVDFTMLDSTQEKIDQGKDDNVMTTAATEMPEVTTVIEDNVTQKQDDYKSEQELTTKTLHLESTEPSTTSGSVKVTIPEVTTKPNIDISDVDNMTPVDEEFIIATKLPDNTDSINYTLEEGKTTIKSTNIDESVPERETTTKSAISTEYITNIPITTSYQETTTLNVQENEILEEMSPARIPGEGDCLFNGITFKNNTSVPSTGKCHSQCRCVSSIIKCDPIICTPPLEYMENMNDCQPIYDSPESCCPTYVCSTKETVAPESHSQMSGTESPKPIIECLGDECHINQDNGMQEKPTEHDCGENGCLTNEHSTLPQKDLNECVNGNCDIKTVQHPVTDNQLCDRVEGCQVPVIKPCEGDNCKTEQDSHEHKDIQDKFESNFEPCDDINGCQVPAITPCKDNNCKSELESPIHEEKDVQDKPEICDTKNGCDKQIDKDRDDICNEENCRRKEYGEVDTYVQCSGTDCMQQETILPTVSDINTPKQEQVTEIHMETTSKPDLDNISQDNTMSDNQSTIKPIKKIDTTEVPIIEESHTETTSPDIQQSFEGFVTHQEEIVTETPNVDVERVTTVSSHTDITDEEIQSTESSISRTDKTTTPTLDAITTKQHLTAATENLPKTSMGYTSEGTEKYTIEYTTSSESLTLDEINKDKITVTDIQETTASSVIFTDKLKLEITTQTEDNNIADEHKFAHVTKPHLEEKTTDNVMSEESASTNVPEMFTSIPQDGISTEHPEVDILTTKEILNMDLTVEPISETTKFAEITTEHSVTEQKESGPSTLSESTQSQEISTENISETESPEPLGTNSISTEISKLDEEDVHSQVVELTTAIQDNNEYEKATTPLALNEETTVYPLLSEKVTDGQLKNETATSLPHLDLENYQTPKPISTEDLESFTELDLLQTTQSIEMDIDREHSGKPEIIPTPMGETTDNIIDDKVSIKDVPELYTEVPSYLTTDSKVYSTSKDTTTMQSDFENITKIPTSDSDHKLEEQTEISNTIKPSISEEEINTSTESPKYIDTTLQELLVDKTTTLESNNESLEDGHRGTTEYQEQTTRKSTNSIFITDSETKTSDEVIHQDEINTKTTTPAYNKYDEVSKETTVFNLPSISDTTEFVSELTTQENILIDISKVSTTESSDKPIETDMIVNTESLPKTDVPSKLNEEKPFSTVFDQEDYSTTTVMNYENTQALYDETKTEKTSDTYDDEKKTTESFDSQFTKSDDYISSEKTDIITDESNTTPEPHVDVVHEHEFSSSTQSSVVSDITEQEIKTTTNIIELKQKETEQPMSLVTEKQSIPVTHETATENIQTVKVTETNESEVTDRSTETGPYLHDEIESKTTTSTESFTTKQVDLINENMAPTSEISTEMKYPKVTTELPKETIIYEDEQTTVQKMSSETPLSMDSEQPAVTEKTSEELTTQYETDMLVTTSTTEPQNETKIKPDIPHMTSDERSEMSTELPEVQTEKDIYATEKPISRLGDQSTEAQKDLSQSSSAPIVPEAQDVTDQSLLIDEITKQPESLTTIIENEEFTKNIVTVTEEPLSLTTEIHEQMSTSSEKQTSNVENVYVDVLNPSTNTPNIILSTITSEKEIEYATEIVTRAPEKPSDSNDYVGSHNEQTSTAEDVTKIMIPDAVSTEIPQESQTDLPTAVNDANSVVPAKPDSLVTQPQYTTVPSEVQTQAPEKITTNIYNENITLQDNINKDVFTSTHKDAIMTSTEQSNIKIMEHETTTETKYEYSETTPYFVELEEHTHQIMQESSVIPIGEISTVETTDIQPTERGDQPLTDKLSEDSKTEKATEVTEKPYDSYPVTTQISEEHTSEEIYQTTELANEVSETSGSTGTSTFEPQKGTGVPSFTKAEPSYEGIVTTTTLPHIMQNEESVTIIPNETEKPSILESEIMASTQKFDNITEDKTQKPETMFTETKTPDETSKSTTTRAVYEEATITSTRTPIVDEKLLETLSTTIKPTSKPDFQPTEEVPEFPPSGVSGYGQEPDYGEEDQAFGPGTCRYGGKVYVSAQQIPRDDPCDFCFCFRSDIICLQQSCPPPIHGCHEEPIQGFCCPRYECPVSMATTLNVTTTTTTTTTTLPPHFLPHAYKGAAQKRGCHIKGQTYKVGEVVRASSGPCLHCTCGGDGQMKCDPKACTPEPMLRQMIAAAVSARRRR